MKKVNLKNLSYRFLFPRKGSVKYLRPSKKSQKFIGLEKIGSFEQKTNFVIFRLRKKGEIVKVFRKCDNLWIFICNSPLKKNKIQSTHHPSHFRWTFFFKILSLFFDAIKYNIRGIKKNYNKFQLVFN